MNRSTHYRNRDRNPSAPTEPARTPPPNRLESEEREHIIAVLNSTRFRDKAPRQVWAALLDEGTYLCSVATMYRLLRERGQSRERRAQATHPPKTKPELVAHAPNQVWSYDITKLRGPGPGRFFDLYVMIDIYSRCVVHWEIHTRESGEIAEGFIANSIAANGQIAAEVIHSDRGTAMTSQPVSELLSMLGITKSHSRPKTSNDNPYSEAHFKTLKYCPAFPDRFGSIQGARRFCRRFFQYYNHEHYHSGIGLHTPFTVHIGTAHAIQDKRAQAIEAFRAANPQRFTRRPVLPALPEAAWINEPDIVPTAQHSADLREAA
ncbi:IS3 family transposase [Nocardiopsis exhalans]|uniref:IS3 family transposase n=1 Tax=Nocardiopsis exhalans TaxID=163604 RepID=A0ABY5DG77_9ACTN|nr:IS3 family transposase [Nocardiopsis exhalans]